MYVVTGLNVFVTASNREGGWAESKDAGIDGAGDDIAVPVEELRSVSALAGLSGPDALAIRFCVLVALLLDCAGSRLVRIRAADRVATNELMEACI